MSMPDPTLPRLPLPARLSWRPPSGHWPWTLVWLAVTAWLVNATWLSWGHLIIDTGVTMYTPWALASGKLLYRDFFYPAGPITPYFHALLYWLFEPHLYLLYASGLVTCVLSGLLIQRLAARHLPPWLGAFVALIFVIKNGFGYYVKDNIFNYIAPYSYTTIHGMLFCLAALWFHGRHLETRGVRHRALALGFLCLTLLTRIELGGYLALAMGFGTLLDAPRGGEGRRQLLREAGLLSLPILAAAAVYFVLLAGARESLFWETFASLASGYDFSKDPTGFYAQAFGYVDAGKNIREIFLSAAATLGAGLLFGAAGAIMGTRVGRGRTAAASLAWSGLAAACGWLGYQSHQIVAFRLAIKYLPLLATILVFFYVWRSRNSEGAERRDAVMLATLAFFSLLAVLRILLRTKYGFNGFSLTVPGLILSQVFLLRELPAMLPQASFRPYVRLGFVIHGLLVAFTLHANTLRAVSWHTIEVQSPRGTMLVKDSPRMRCLDQLIDLLGRRPGEKAELVVFPEGVGINFLTGMANPLYLNMYLPYDLASPDAVDLVIQQMEETRPEYVIQVLVNVRMFGKEGFGVDYGLPIVDYLEKNYSLVHYVPDACMLLRRNDRM